MPGQKPSLRPGLEKTEAKRSQPEILTLKRWRQDGREFKATFHYIKTLRPTEVTRAPVNKIKAFVAGYQTALVESV